MPVLSLNLTQEAVASYAKFKGYVQNDDQSREEFVTQRIFDVVQNDLIEQRNREAIATAQAQPAPVVSPDQEVRSEDTPPVSAAPEVPETPAVPENNDISQGGLSENGII